VRFHAAIRRVEALYRKYRERGFEVLAFPANNFMGRSREATPDQVVLRTKYSTTFPLFSKISVKGKSIHPLYAYLTKESRSGRHHWNFNKFLVNPDGSGRAFRIEHRPASKK